MQQHAASGACDLCGQRKWRQNPVRSLAAADADKSVCYACRRTLDSPDFQLLVRFDEDCSCGSRQQRASCCFTTCEANEGGVLWPLFHCCQCNNPFDVFMNPKASLVPVTCTGWHVLRTQYMLLGWLYKVRDAVRQPA